jgi:hypothetical protein
MAESEQSYTSGELLTLSSKEGGFSSKPQVEFQGISNGGTQARVKSGLEIPSVPLEQLSRPAQSWLPGRFQTPKAPVAPTEQQIAEKLAQRRQALAKTYDRAELAQEKVTATRAVSQHADREVAEARATLATLSAHDRAEQSKFEESIQLGRPLSVRLNGHDRNYIVQRVTAAEQPQQRFDRELAEATASLSDSLSAVRKAAADVVAALLERETETSGRPNSVQLCCALS